MAGCNLQMRCVLLALVAVLGAVTLPVIGTAPLSAQCHVCVQGAAKTGQEDPPATSTTVEEARHAR